MKPLALALILLLLFSGCATTMTNAVGETRTCAVPGGSFLAACAGKESCLIVGAVIGAIVLATAGFYAYCVHRAHQDGFE